MPRLSLASLGLCCLASCHPSSRPPSPTTIACPQQPTQGTVAGEEAEPKAIVATPNLVQRQGASLLLRLADGRTIVLRDSLGDSVAAGDFIRYRLLDFRKTLDAFEVEVGAWEGSATLLVSIRTGHRSYLWGTPVPAPAGHRLAALSYDLAAEYNPNGIQIWRTDRDTLELEWQVALKHWGPTDGRWIDSTTLVLRRNNEFHPQGDSLTGCAILRRVGVRWELTPGDL